MSRCFPFPPPGYVVNGIRDDVAMIDSIKGAEEKCKKEHNRKERKRDKKENKDKKEKKDKKRKERERGEGDSEKHSHKRRRKEEEVAKDVQNHQKVDVFGKLKESDVFGKLKESENNCLEKSSLTVERELLQQSTSQNSCDSTLNSNEKKQPIDGRHNKKDSTINSNELPKEKEKEKQTLIGRHNNNVSTLNRNEVPTEKEKEKQPLDGRHNTNNNDSESIIRIRLPIRRPKDPELMVITNKDQTCPSRDVKLDTTSQSVTREQPQHLCSTSAPEHVSKPHEEKRKKHTSTRKHKEKKLPSTTTQGTYQPSSLCRLCPPSMAEQFLNVVENWVPNTIESRVELSSSEEDECWWLVKKPSTNKTHTERCKLLNRNNETKEVISSSIPWPRASLLPEADVYALPYTVPF